MKIEMPKNSNWERMYSICRKEQIKLNLLPAIVGEFEHPHPQWKLTGYIVKNII